MWTYYDSTEPHSSMGFDDISEAIAHAIAQHGPEAFWLCAISWSVEQGMPQSIWTVWACEEDSWQEDCDELAVAEIRSNGGAA